MNAYSPTLSRLIPLADPLDHPELRRLDLRILADMPFPRPGIAAEPAATDPSTALPAPARVRRSTPLGQLIAALRRRAALRRQMRQLEQLPNWLLDDIGLPPRRRQPTPSPRHSWLA